jgi:hypothetical protein
LLAPAALSAEEQARLQALLADDADEIEPRREGQP